MKRNASIFFTILQLVIGLSVITGCKQVHQDPLDYNNSLIKVLDKNTRDMQAMNSAMTSGDYHKAADVRKAWIRHLEKAQDKVKSLGGYNGDQSFQKTVLNGLKRYKKIVAGEYAQLISIRREGLKDQSDLEREVLTKINETFTQVGNTIDREETDFDAQYGKSNELTDKFFN